MVGRTGAPCRHYRMPVDYLAPRADEIRSVATTARMLSVIVPVYKSAENIDDLLRALDQLNDRLDGQLEVVFVVDGSPDDSYRRLADRLPTSRLCTQLVELSRNFGSFSAIRAGFAAARGERFAVLAADLQEPIELVEQFDRLLRTGECDVTIGQRIGRRDPLPSRMTANIFWWAFRRWVQNEVPPGGVDVFGCTRQVRRHLLRLREGHSSLVGLLFWVGFRRAMVPYERQQRTAGTSAWTFRRKLRYFVDSGFSFTDLPISLLLMLGGFGLVTSVIFSIIVLVSKLLFLIPVPGYVPTVLLVTFFGALNCFGLGVIGSYVWRTYENSKGRPNFIVRSRAVFGDP